MRPVARRASLLFGLFGLAGLCVAGVLAFEFGPFASRSVEPGEITASVGGQNRLPLSEEQRGRIFDRIMKLDDTPVADVPAPDAATVLPNSVELQELPPSVTREIPAVQGYKFVKLDDRILLVSPRDRTVVAEMPRYHIVVD